MRLELQRRRGPEYNCFICLNRTPSRIRKATCEGKYPNMIQEFYYCDDAECEKKYMEMHQNHKPNQGEPLCGY